jgi:hypothetical protein
LARRVVDLPQVPLLNQWHQPIMPEMWRADGAGGVSARDAYQVIPPADVRAGDTYKFTPANNGSPIFAVVIEVERALGLVHIGKNGGPGVWTYITPRVGVVTFGRVVSEPSPRAPATA